MHSRLFRLATPLALLALLGGCDFIKSHTGGAPKGQVVATVEGQEVTLQELQAELPGGLPQDPNAVKAVQLSVLQRIVARDVLAKAAKDQKLDQTPQFAMQMSRAKSNLMAQLVERKMASEVPPPSRDDAERFVADHPTMFSQRQMFTVEQIQTAPTNDQNLLRALAPLKSLEDIESLLNSKGVAHQRTMTMLDGLRTDPKLIEQINKLPAGEPFIVPTGNGLLINQVKDTRSLPFTGEPAIQVAMRSLANQRTQEAIAKQGKAMMDAASEKIKYNPDYDPAKFKAPSRPAAPAAK
jgi:EpsD family peptidyl-prolyl cis-trans isomerase